MTLFQWVIYFCRVQRNISQIFTLQAQDLKNKLDSALFFLYEKNNLIKIDLELPDSLNFEDPDKLKEELDKLNEEFDKRNEGRYNFLEIMEKTHDLISQAEKDVLIVDDQSYEITLKAVQELAKICWKIWIFSLYTTKIDNSLK